MTTLASQVPDLDQESHYTTLLNRVIELLASEEDEDRLRRQVKQIIVRSPMYRDLSHEAYANDMIRSARAASRQERSWRDRKPARQQVTTEQQENIQRFTTGIFNFRLWGGKPIGKATAADLRKSVAGYDKHIAGYLVPRTFNALVLARMEKAPVDSIVEDVLSFKDLAKLYTKAERKRNGMFQ